MADPDDDMTVVAHNPSSESSSSKPRKKKGRKRTVEVSTPPPKLKLSPKPPANQSWQPEVHPLGKPIQLEDSAQLITSWPINTTSDGRKRLRFDFRLADTHQESECKSIIHKPSLDLDAWRGYDQIRITPLHNTPGHYTSQFLIQTFRIVS